LEIALYDLYPWYKVTTTPNTNNKLKIISGVAVLLYPTYANKGPTKRTWNKLITGRGIYIIKI